MSVCMWQVLAVLSLITFAEKIPEARDLWKKPASTLASIHIPVGREHEDVSTLCTHSNGVRVGKGDALVHTLALAVLLS